MNLVAMIFGYFVIVFICGYLMYRIYEACKYMIMVSFVMPLKKHPNKFATVEDETQDT